MTESIEAPAVLATRTGNVQKPHRKPARSRVPDIGLGMLLRNANATFNKVLREELALHGISFSQYQHLRQLWEQDGIAQVELSRRIGIETASSTSVIDQLEKRGFIERERSAQDKRRIIVSVTDAGRALERPLNDCAVLVNKRARRGLSPPEIEELFRLLKRIGVNLKDD